VARASEAAVTRTTVLGRVRTVGLRGEYLHARFRELLEALLAAVPPPAEPASRCEILGFSR